MQFLCHWFEGGNGAGGWIRVEFFIGRRAIVAGRQP
jgi:hypothetical protein